MPITKEERSKKSKEAWAKRRIRDEAVRVRRISDTWDFIESLGDEGRQNLLFSLLHDYSLLNMENRTIVLGEPDPGCYYGSYSEYELPLEDLIKCPLP